jgi:lipoyltransferase 1
MCTFIFVSIALTTLVTAAEDPYPPMTCVADGTLDSSKYDQPSKWTRGDGNFLNGMHSTHSNSKEDRIFSMRYCHPPQNSRHDWQGFEYTNYDAAWVRGCGGGSAIYYTYSVHSNSKEDRQFYFACAMPHKRYVLSSCSWTEMFPGSYGGAVYTECPDNGVIRSIYSQHDNGHEDRKFGFECCRIADNPYTMASMTCSRDEDYTNEYDGVHSGYLPGYFLSGLYSVHSNSKDDRRFKWLYCTPDGGYVATQELDVTEYDKEWTRTCASHAHAAIYRAYSTHSNSREDRAWTFSCGTLAGEYQLANCGWTGWLNNWDGVIDLHCPDDGVIRGIKSKHDNSREDRLYRFDCCQVYTYTNYEFSRVDGFWSKWNWDDMVSSGSSPVIIFGFRVREIQYYGFMLLVFVLCVFIFVALYLNAKRMCCMGKVQNYKFEKVKMEESASDMEDRALV